MVNVKNTLCQESMSVQIVISDLFLYHPLGYFNLVGANSHF